MIKNRKIASIVSQLGTLMALIILCLILTIATPNFLKIDNIMNILKQTSVNALISTGMLVCLITGGIDLSVGANAITCTCLMGMLLNRGISNIAIVLPLVLLLGTFIGFLNGTLLTRLHLPHPFVSTLGMKNVLSGVALLLVDSKMISGFSPGAMWLGSYSVGSFKMSSGKVFPGIPVSFVLVIIIFIVMGVFLSKTALGRSIYCVGGNPEASRLSGINSANVLTFCYALSGFMCAIAGIVIVGRTGICNGANAVQPYETDAIAACIIGGASFLGGKGTMRGTMIGALIISVIRNGLTLLAASSAIQYVVLGLVIILAVLIDITRQRVSAKARRLAAAKA